MGGPPEGCSRCRGVRAPPEAGLRHRKAEPGEERIVQRARARASEDPSVKWDKGKPTSRSRPEGRGRGDPPPALAAVQHLVNAP